MDVRNCRRCKRIFNYVMGPIYCAECKKALEEEFQVVKKYVQDNPGSDIHMVSEACDVDPSQIRQWIREERLCFSDGSATGLSCERCGVMIRTGRFCEKCKLEMSNGFRNAVRKDPASASTRQDAKTNPKMRFLE